jgi:hypothetical protein
MDSEMDQVISLFSRGRTPDRSTAAEMSAILRVGGGNESQGYSTAFLVSDTVALTSSLVTRALVGNRGSEDLVVERAILDQTSTKEAPKFERVSIKEIIRITSDRGSSSEHIVALRLAKSLSGVTPFRIAENRRKVRVLGRGVHLISIGNIDTRVQPWLLDLYEKEFGLPTYLTGTVLRYGEGTGELAYDVLTTGGSAGAPVIDNRTKAVIGINYKGLGYGDLTKIGAGTDIIGLGSSPKLREVVGDSLQTTDIGVDPDGK